MAGLGIEPELSGASHEFLYEGKTVTIHLPPVRPFGSAPVHPHQAAFSDMATVSVIDANKNPVFADVSGVLLVISSLSFSIPLAAAETPHINCGLYSPEQAATLDKESDELHSLAARASAYWLRVAWWKTGNNKLSLVSELSYGTYDGGSLVNNLTHTRFYTPRKGRVVYLSSKSPVTAEHWSAIQKSLSAMEEPPIWHQYLISARRRLDGGDRHAAILDLSIAAEARIRTRLNDALPAGTSEAVRRTVKRLNMADIIAKWNAHGLPEFSELKTIRELLETRNGLMHSGTHENTTESFVNSAASAVSKLLSVI